eukprot:gene3731-2628_t
METVVTATKQQERDKWSTIPWKCVGVVYDPQRSRKARAYLPGLKKGAEDVRNEWQTSNTNSHNIHEPNRLTIHLCSYIKKSAPPPTTNFNSVSLWNNESHVSHRPLDSFSSSLLNNNNNNKKLCTFASLFPQSHPLSHSLFISLSCTQSDALSIAPIIGNPLFCVTNSCSPSSLVNIFSPGAAHTFVEFETNKQPQQYIFPLCAVKISAFIHFKRTS